MWIKNIIFIYIRLCSSFIRSVFCLTTGPKPPPKRFLLKVRSRASSFKWEYPLLSIRSSSSFLRLLPPLLVTSISPFIFPSITCFIRQFLRKMWPIQLDFALIRLRSYGHFNSHTRPRVNRVLRNQLAGDVLNLVAYLLRCQHYLRQLNRAVHNRAAACVAAGGGIFRKPALSTDQFKVKVISRS